MKKIISIILTLCLLLSMSSIPAFGADEDITVTLDGTEIVFDVPPQTINDRTMVPMRAIFEALGCTVTWADETQTITAVKDGKTMTMQIGNKTFNCGDQVISLDVPPTEIDGRTLVPVRAISEGLDCTVEWVEGTKTVIITSPGNTVQLSKNAAVINDTYIGDEYRLPDDGGMYNGLLLAGTMALDLNTISDEAAIDYATVLNTVADALPGVNMYSIVVPTSDEFYAPKQYYGNQLSGIKKIYSNLSDKITAINVVKPLYEHAGEKIYYSTDHHWTHRGSYYAYQAFKAAKGETAPALDSYETANTDGFLGTFAKKLEGTPAYDILSANPDYLERWLPKTEANGTSYLDQDMQEVQYSNLPVVETKYDGYNAFICGDFPFTKYTTSAGTGKKLVVVKESYGNAFTTWNVDDYDEIYVIDIRRFNGNDGNNNPLSLSYLHSVLNYDDLVVVTYPPMLSYHDGRHLLEKMK